MGKVGKRGKDKNKMEDSEKKKDQVGGSRTTTPLEIDEHKLPPDGYLNWTENQVRGLCFCWKRHEVFLRLGLERGEYEVFLRNYKDFYPQEYQDMIKEGNAFHFPQALKKDIKDRVMEEIGQTVFAREAGIRQLYYCLNPPQDEREVPSVPSLFRSSFDRFPTPKLVDVITKDLSCFMSVAERTVSLTNFSILHNLDPQDVTLTNVLRIVFSHNSLVLRALSLSETSNTKDSSALPGNGEGEGKGPGPQPRIPYVLILLALVLFHGQFNMAESDCLALLDLFHHARARLPRERRYLEPILLQGIAKRQKYLPALHASMKEKKGHRDFFDMLGTRFGLQMTFNHFYYIRYGTQGREDPENIDQEEQSLIMDCMVRSWEAFKEQH